MPTHDRFNLAFENLRLSDIDLSTNLYREVEYRSIGVLLTINRFYPFVHARMCREGCEIRVEWDGDPYGKLFAEISKRATIPGTAGSQC